MDKNHRLFLRNLPIDIESKNLQNFFGEYGTVTKIDIKDKTQSDGGKIAFVNITTTDLRLNTCFRLAREKSFGGRVIQVQLAKESYLDRLKREREEAAESARAPNLARDSSIRGPIEKINIKVPAGVQSRSTKKKYDFEDARENDRDAGASPDPPDFSWDPALQERTIPAAKKLVPGEESVEPSKPSHPPVEKPQKKVLAQAEIKRLAAIKNMRQTFNFRRKLITQALKTDSSGSKSNKIVFSQDDEPYVAGKKNTAAAAVSLFDNSDDDDDDEQDRRLDKFEHDETRSAKLKLSLRNRTGDKRFAMDERFLDDAGEADESEAAAAAADNETEWQLGILEKVLGKPLGERKDESGEKKKKVYKMIRYDPSDESHRKYELPMAEKPAIGAKKVKKLKREQEEAPPPPPPVSTEIYYEVSKNLTESFNTQEEFSLLKTFGTAAPPPNDKNSTSDYVGASIAAAASLGEKSMQYGIKDPFKYESSSDEEEGASMNDEIVARSGTTKSETIDDDDEEEPFSFVENDRRFREAVEFFKRRPQTSDFSSVRRRLKQIVRSKIRNNVRKNTRWKNSKVAKRPNIR